MINRTNQNLSTALLCLTLVGYPVTIITFAPLIETYGSQAVTIPYRATCLATATIVLLMNMGNAIPSGAKRWTLACFWIAYSAKITFDIAADKGCDADFNNKSLIFTLLICAPALIATLASSDAIDARKALKWSFWAGGIAIITSFFRNEALYMAPEDVTDRVSIGEALNTISFGLFAAEVFIMGLFLSKTTLSKAAKIIILTISLAAAFSAFKAGSRGPIMGLIFSLLFWTGCKGRNMITGLFAAALAATLVYAFSDSILETISNFAPVFVERWKSMLEGDSSGRDQLYQEAWNCFKDAPLTGGIYCLPSCGQNSHNSFLDILMALGLAGGLAFLSIIAMSLHAAKRLIATNSEKAWIAVLLITEIVLSMTSTPLYNAPALLSIMAIILSTPSATRPPILR